MSATILIVDDEAPSRYGIRRALEKEGYILLEADSIAAAETALQNSSPEVVILDVKLAAESGLEYLPTLVSRRAAPSVIIMTAHGSERVAVEAIKKGAFDYLAKPFEIDELRITVRNAYEASLLRAENEKLRHELTGATSFGDLIGASAPMKLVYSMIEKVAQTDVNVLITGESGTGKELVAKEIHNRSQVRSGPFIAMNCAAVPTELIESELFGHEKGAFTGANFRRIGKFEAANGGTLFLDEVGDMSLATQAKVLRVLDDKTIQRLGSNTSVRSDVRIISATNKRLENEIGKERFREDLYYRLCVVKVELPPLRDRGSDIVTLANTFCRRFSTAHGRSPLGVSKEAARVLLLHSWPGNVRELRNCIERAIVLAEGEEITIENLPESMLCKPQIYNKIPSADAISVNFTDDFKQARKEFERRYIEKCLERTGGNVTRAAALLGMHRQSLQHKLRELGLQKRFSL